VPLRSPRGLLLAAVCLAPLPAGPAERERSVRVQLLAINDFHGNLEPPAGANGEVNGTPAGGAEYLATHVANAFRDNPNSLLVAAGDLIGASPFLSASFHDEPTVEALSAMRLAVAAVGNHEFDEGPRELSRMTRGGCHPQDGCQDGDGFAGARFQYLSANVVEAASGKTLFPPIAVRGTGGVRIGFIGATLEGTPRIVSPLGTRGLRFLDVAQAANQHAAALVRRGVRAIVLLVHEGGRQWPAQGDTDPNGCEGFTGALTPVLEKLSADVSVVVSGHTHQFYNCRIGGRLVTSAGSFGRMFTRIALDVDRGSGRITSASAQNQVATRDVAKDPAQTRILVKYGALAEAKASQVVGSASAALTRVANSAGESALGDVIADPPLAATPAPENGGAEVAFMNVGGIRADVGAGDVRYRDLFEVQPFGNVLMVVTLTGEQLRRLLEQQFERPSAARGRLLQVSSGFAYSYRAGAPAGQKVDADSIRIAGRRVAPGDRIRVAASDFLANGGESIAVLGEGTDRVVGVADIDALVAYFKARSPVAPGPQDRIIRID
jgi:5'-nucleotidase